MKKWLGDNVMGRKMLGIFGVEIILSSLNYEREDNWGFNLVG